MARSNILAFSILSILSGGALADSPVLQPEVIVTASRVAQTETSTLAAISVITRADIETSQARDLIDVLRLQPGIDVARSGGAGGQTSIFLRGSNSNHVLVLIDGVRVASANTGAFAFEQLSLDNVERIEIVRGPRASYWGSDAIGGVIQIFTRKLDAPRIALGYGSHNERVANAGIGQWNEHGGFSVQLGLRNYDGFPSQNENGYGYEDKNHGMRQRSFAARGERAIGSQTLGASALRTEATVEFAGGESDVDEQAIDVSLHGAISQQWQHRLSISEAREDLSTAAYFSRFATRRQNASWINEFSMGGDLRLIAGVDFSHEKGESTDTWSGTRQYGDSRDNSGVFVGWQARYGSLGTDVAVRRDHNSEFGNANTGSAALGWQFAEPLRVWASHGQGFRAPNLNEQFSPGFGGMYAGNPALDPERSRSNELGLDYTPVAGQQLGVNLSSTRVSDLISFTGANFSAENIARAKLDSAELTYTANSVEWSWHSAVTLLNARNQDTGQQLLRRAKRKFSSSLDHTFNAGLQAGAELIYVGPRDDVGMRRLPGYTLLNLRANWTFAPDWKLGARVENVTDRDYEMAYGFNTPGRTGFVEMVWSPRR
ncbi:MAG: TonB-dependent receptor [Dokdonella sp.]